jgi:hypothetical protein
VLDLDALDALLLIFDSNLLGLTLLSVLFCFFVKEKKAGVFSLITFIFFSLGFLTYDLILNIDPNIVVRYVLWAFTDITWMGLIAYLTIKDKIHLWQSILGQLIVLPAPLLQLMRLVDRHYFDLSYTTYLYKTLLPIINMATVALCFAPLIVIFTQYLKNKKTEEKVEV